MGEPEQSCRWHGTPNRNYNKLYSIDTCQSQVNNRQTNASRADVLDVTSVRNLLILVQFFFFFSQIFILQCLSYIKRHLSPAFKLLYKRVMSWPKAGFWKAMHTPKLHWKTAGHLISQNQKTFSDLAHVIITITIVKLLKPLTFFMSNALYLGILTWWINEACNN